MRTHTTGCTKKQYRSWLTEPSSRSGLTVLATTAAAGGGHDRVGVQTPQQHVDQRWRSDVGLPSKRRRLPGDDEVSNVPKVQRKQWRGQTPQRQNRQQRRNSSSFPAQVTVGSRLGVDRISTRPDNFRRSPLVSDQIQFQTRFNCL